MSWECKDPDGDFLTYFVYFEANDTSPDVLVTETQSPYYLPDILNFSTTYYWQIVAWDFCEKTLGSIWYFTTRNNTPPNKPNNPTPPDNSTNVSTNPILRWRCSDPEEDNLTYNVYFEENDPTPDMLISENQTYKWIKLENLNFSTLYYWKIVAWDEYGLSTSGPVWNFTTTSVPNNPPHQPHNPNPGDGMANVGIDTTLSWTVDDDLFC